MRSEVLSCEQRRRLEEAIEAIESRGGAGENGESAGVAPTGWGPVDEALGGLERGAIHEWISDDGGGAEDTASSWASGPVEGPARRLGGGAGSAVEGADVAKPTSVARSVVALWRPAVGVAVHLARRALGEEHRCRGADIGGTAVWIGTRCWPLARALVAGGDRSLVERSVFVDAPDRAARAWAMDLALRSGAVGAVIADGSGLDMSATRRLQLAARESGAIGLLLRPGAERRALSAAQTRWVVRPAPAQGRRPTWEIELVRRKGGALPELRVRLEWDHETGAVVVAADVVGGCGAEEVSSGARRTA
ncbi:MAG: ImuA family protein [Phycisphaerales bacterium JB039]